MTEQLLQLQ